MEDGPELERPGNGRGFWCRPLDDSVATIDQLAQNMLQTSLLFEDVPFSQLCAPEMEPKWLILPEEFLPTKITQIRVS